MGRDWRSEIVALRAKPGNDLMAATLQVLTKACGGALSLRQARVRLFSIAVAAGDGTPQLFALEGRHFVIISVDDFAGVICDPTLDELFAILKGKETKTRRKITNR